MQAILIAVGEVINRTSPDEDEELPEGGMMDFMDWKEGTEMYSHLDEHAIDKLLGINQTNGTFLDFNDTEDPDCAHDPWSVEGRKFLKEGLGVPLRLRWHQKVGILRIFENKFAQKNMALGDEVGVGKTGQALATIAGSVQYEAFHAKHGRYPGKFGALLRSARSIR